MPETATLWARAHPFWIYAPIFMFLFVPVALFTTMCVNRCKRTACAESALLALMLGTGALYIMYTTPPATSNLVITSSELRSALDNHRTLTGDARGSLGLATLLFALGFLICKYAGLRPSELTTTVPLGFAVFYVTGMLALLSAAAEAEKLVHVFGAIPGPSCQ